MCLKYYKSVWQVQIFKKKKQKKQKTKKNKKNNKSKKQKAKSKKQYILKTNQ
jgi:hypothetical protein